ncbi:Hypothetical protein PMT_2377 [Prochlorococcus marinus str. MIT 9313]|uniref:Uncharacterized protein n=1 Tax=Prochlorococcus marinus (strain MIT 9313) TaxID=74547 RepID=B9ER55_PROMM|nr:Hypothetical protein PMT_2377 [Prochlorococcus marinus str. MIT 9313]
MQNWFILEVSKARATLLARLKSIDPMQPNHVIAIGLFVTKSTVSKITAMSE